MRKIVLTLVTVVLIILSVLCVTNGAKPPIKIYSYSQIEQKNAEVTSQMDELKRLKSNENKVK